MIRTISCAGFMIAMACVEEPGTEDNADCGAFVSGDDFEVRVTGLSTQTYQVMLSWIRPPPATSRILATWDSVLVRGPED